MPANRVYFSSPRASLAARMSVVLVITATLVLAQFLAPLEAEAQSDCCIVRGNVDCDPGDQIDISDLVRLIDYMFVTSEPLCCPEAANSNGDPEGSIDIADLVLLIDYMFVTYEPLVPCGPIELTSEQRGVVFNSLDSAFSSLGGMPADSVATNLASFLNSQPGIDTAGVIDSVSVWAWFTDGRILLVPNNRPSTGPALDAGDWPESSLGTVIPPDFVIPERRFTDWEVTAELNRAPADPAADDPELPFSIQARVISTLSTSCFTTGAPLIRTLLEDHGYVTVPSTGSVPALLNVSGDGVFYMDAHGGMGADNDTNQFLAVWTATPYSPDNDSIFAGMLRRDELVYMYCSDRDPSTGTCIEHFRYAYTAKFVAQYMSFVPNSLVIIAACQTDSLPSLRQGFAAAGASVFAGWSRTVRDFPANRGGEFLLDRTLGANSSKLTPKETPPQRPFNVDLVWQDMKNRGFDTDPNNQAKLRVRHLGDNFGILAPSIRYMFVIENSDSFFVTGDFGSDPGAAGRVIVGGTELPILEWTPDMITAFIPNTGLGSAGPVSVEVDGILGPSYSVKRKSNVVNLTEWRGPIAYTTHDAGSLTGTIVINTHVRADVHHFRESPHTPPVFYSIYSSAAEDSYGTVTANGQFSYTSGSPPTTDTWSWTGSDFVKGGWETYPNQFIFAGRFLDATHQLELMFTAFAWSGIFETLVNSDDGLQYTIPITVGTPFELYDIYPYFYLDLSDVWEIQAGERNAVTCCSHDPDNTESTPDITHRLSWPTILPYFPPDTTEGQ